MPPQGTHLGIWLGHSCPQAPAPFTWLRSQQLHSTHILMLCCVAKEAGLLGCPGASCIPAPAPKPFSGLSQGQGPWWFCSWELYVTPALPSGCRPSGFPGFSFLQPPPGPCVSDSDGERRWVPGLCPPAQMFTSPSWHLRDVVPPSSNPRRLIQREPKEICRVILNVKRDMQGGLLRNSTHTPGGVCGLCSMKAAQTCSAGLLWYKCIPVLRGVIKGDVFSRGEQVNA